MAYLNRRDKDRVLMMAGMVSTLDEWIANIEEHRQRATHLKYARTYLFKQMDSLMLELDANQRADIVAEADRREVGFYVK